MPKATTPPSANSAVTSTITATAPVPAQRATAEERLDEIALYLHRIDRRDRIRTIGGTIRSIIALIPLLLFLFSAWYIYANGTSLLQMITEEAAKQAVKYSPTNSDFMNQFEQYFKK